VVGYKSSLQDLGSSIWQGGRVEEQFAAAATCINSSSSDMSWPTPKAKGDVLVGRSCVAVRVSSGNCHQRQVQQQLRLEDQPNSHLQ
jgi:hypothetical protein